MDDNVSSAVEGGVKAAGTGVKAAAVKVIAGVAAAAVLGGGGVLVGKMAANQNAEPSAVVESVRPDSIGYAAEGVMILDDDFVVPESQEELARRRGVGVEYKNDAYSTDGVNFSCWLGNAELNGKDMFIVIYADESLEDEVFVSQLLRPGTGFNSVTLNRALEPGDHNMIVALTLVEGEEENIYAQSLISMIFHVSAE